MEIKQEMEGGKIREMMFKVTRNYMISHELGKKEKQKTLVCKSIHIQFK